MSVKKDGSRNGAPWRIVGLISRRRRITRASPRAAKGGSSTRPRKCCCHQICVASVMLMYTTGPSNFDARN